MAALEGEEEEGRVARGGLAPLDGDEISRPRQLCPSLSGRGGNCTFPVARHASFLYITAFMQILMPTSGRNHYHLL